MGWPIKLGHPKEPRHLVHGTLSEAEITLLIAAARTVREWAMIATLAYAGLHNRVLCRLHIHDVDLSGQTLHVQATNTQKDRYAHIAAQYVSVLAEYMRERAAGQTTGCSSACAAAKIERRKSSLSIGISSNHCRMTSFWFFAENL